MTDSPVEERARPPVAEAASESKTPEAEARPAPTFDVLPLSRELRETLAEIGYVNPTPVQIAVWDPATRGKDVVVQAQTGTGKTAAFGLPIVDHVVRRSSATAQVLVLCPTRELAVQVSSEIERLGSKKGVKVLAIYGGAGMQKQIEGIEAGAQVVVGTPGRVLDHLRRRTLDPKHVRLVVLDESDEMLSMGFERELTAILETLPPERQTLLFSATLPPDIERIAKNKLHSPEFLTLSGDHIGALSIQHFVYMVASDKANSLVRVLEVENPESAVIFCNTKDETENLAQAIGRKGWDADWLNGDLPQADREKVMRATREGRLRFLVATDVAARGIDISHLTHVINYDFPQDAETYVHRTGRTGRAGRTGTAISLITPRDVGGLYLLRLTYKIRPIEKQIPTEGELKTREEADLVTMLAEAFGSKGTHPDDLALARRLLTHDGCDRIIAGLLRDHLGARPNAKQEASTARRATHVPAHRAQPDIKAAPPASGPVPAPREERPPSRVQPRAEQPAGRNREAQPQDRGRREPPRNDEAPRGPRRAADLAMWQPPEEEGDEQPILGARERDAANQPPPGARERDAANRPDRPALPSREEGPWRGERRRRGELRRGREPVAPETDRSGPARPEREPSRGPSPIAAPADAPAPAPAAAADATEVGFVEIYVNVGRREGARAMDLQRLLVEKASIEKSEIRRIRVRDRNAFVSVRREDLDRAIAALAGETIGGKAVTAAVAREKAAVEEPEPPTPRKEALPPIAAPEEPDGK